MRKIFVFTLCTIAFVLNARILDKEWKTDIEFLKEQLPKYHYNFEKLNNNNFEKKLDWISDHLDRLSDFEIAVKLQQIIAGLGDSHTLLSYGRYIDVNKILPIHLYWFKDGIYILYTNNENKTILGHKIVKINDISIDVIVDSLSTLITADNKAMINKSIPDLITSVQLLEFFKFIKSDSINLHLENENGEKYIYTITPTYMDRKNRISFIPDSLALCYRDERSYFIDYKIEKDNIYYIQYNSCWSQEHPPPGFRGNVRKLPSFIDFQNKAIETLKKESYDKIIIDIRFNGGGVSPQGTAFIKELSVIKQVNQKGKLYVIIGRKTFSSAVINAMDFKNMTNAILVGEETSGKPNHFGEVRSFTLPFSGLKVQFSTKYFKRVDEDLNTITPDITIETDFKNFKNGIDPVYEWIKNN